MPAELHYNLGKNDVKLEKQHVKNELEQTGNGNCQLLWGLSDNTTCREFRNYLFFCENVGNIIQPIFIPNFKFQVRISKVNRDRYNMVDVPSGS